MEAQRSALDWSFEALAGVALLAMAAFLAMHWSALPTRVPRHFGASGRPDGWGGKGTLLVLPAIALVTWCVLTAAAKFQSLINVSMDVDRARPEVKALLLSMVVVLKAVMAAVFAYISWMSVNTALGKASGLGRFFLPGMLAATAAPLVFYLAKLRRYRVA